LPANMRRNSDNRPVAMSPHVNGCAHFEDCAFLNSRARDVAKGSRLFDPPPGLSLRLLPKSRPMRRSKASLFNQLVGYEEDARWYGESERLGNFEVDDQLVLCWRFNWKVGRPFALEDAIDIAGRAPVLIN
jgi:hypothetical protein